MERYGRDDGSNLGLEGQMLCEPGNSIPTDILNALREKTIWLYVNQDYMVGGFFAQQRFSRLPAEFPSANNPDWSVGQIFHALPSF
jgi:hypothetical protein